MKIKINPLMLTACIGMLFFLMGTFPVEGAKNTKPRLYIKGLAGMQNAKTGDFDDFYTQNSLFYSEFEKANTGYTISFTRPRKDFRGLGGEIGLETDRFAVGISADFIEKEYNLLLDYNDATTGYSEKRTWNYSLKAVPIFVMFHYKLINSGILTISLSVGEGVYLIRYRDIRNQTFENADLTFSNGIVTSKKYQLGFHGGTSIELKVMPNFSLCIDAAYRFVKLENMNATSYFEDDLGIITKKNQLYYSVNPDTGEARFSSSKYGLPWDSRLAKMRLDGLTLSAGIKIIFGSVKKSNPTKADSGE